MPQHGPADRAARASDANAGTAEHTGWGLPAPSRGLGLRPVPGAFPAAAGAVQGVGSAPPFENSGRAYSGMTSPDLATREDDCHERITMMTTAKASPRPYAHTSHNRTETWRRSSWGAATPSLASLLFAVPLVCANGPFLVTAVLPGVPAIRAPVHPLGLGDGERAVS